jgi:hypothetical protein
MSLSKGADVTLYKLSNGYYMWKRGQASFVCPMDNDIYEIGKTFGISVVETEVALREMEANNHQIAFFGVMDKFCYSKELSQ